MWHIPRRPAFGVLEGELPSGKGSSSAAQLLRLVRTFLPVARAIVVDGTPTVRRDGTWSALNGSTGAKGGYASYELAATGPKTLIEVFGAAACLSVARTFVGSFSLVRA